VRNSDRLPRSLVFISGQSGHFSLEIGCRVTSGKSIHRSLSPFSSTDAISQCGATRGYYVVSFRCIGSTSSGQFLIMTGHELHSHPNLRATPPVSRDILLIWRYVPLIKYLLILGVIRRRSPSICRSRRFLKALPSFVRKPCPRLRYTICTRRRLFGVKRNPRYRQSLCRPTAYTEKLGSVAANFTAVFSRRILRAKSV
jgi:hypothetical protein